MFGICTGALSERNGEHGSAHFLEHAMHQGTTTVGVKDRDVDRKLLRAIDDTEQELLGERNAHRNDVRERNVFYDEGGAIGRRYRRQDEIGTPFGVTIDFETLGEKGEELRDTVTLRDRDSMKQERVAIKDLPQLIPSKIR